MVACECSVGMTHIGNGTQGGSDKLALRRRNTEEGVTGLHTATDKDINHGHTAGVDENILFSVDDIDERPSAG